ncbi:hypothetical protein D3C71_1579660 [compost metagenome]
MPLTSTWATPVLRVLPPLTSKLTSPPPNRSPMALATAAAASRYRSLPTPLALVSTVPFSAYSAISCAVRTRLPAASCTLALFTTLACASGLLPMGKAVLL